MKTVAVLGGGPAGASAAERLARAGLNTIVFDGENLAWEKLPCGGGLTSTKPTNSIRTLIDNDTPKKSSSTRRWSALKVRAKRR